MQCTCERNQDVMSLCSARVAFLFTTRPWLQRYWLRQEHDFTEEQALFPPAVRQELREPWLVGIFDAIHTWSSTPPLGAKPSVTTTLSLSSLCMFAIPAGSSAIRTPSAVPLTPP